ncbi:MAG: rhodanese-like domain-containing protein [Cyanobacteriota bacterium]
MYKKVVFVALIALSLNMGCAREEFPLLDETILEDNINIQSTKIVETTPEETNTAMLKKTHVLLDVREQNEYQEVHIKDIKLLPLSILPQEISKLDKNAKYITICRSGKRSAAAAEQMEKIGLNVVSMKGGMLSWIEKKLPVVKGTVKKVIK